MPTVTTSVYDTILSSCVTNPCTGNQSDYYSTVLKSQEINTFPSVEHRVKPTNWQLSQTSRSFSKINWIYGRTQITETRKLYCSSTGKYNTYKARYQGVISAIPTIKDLPIPSTALALRLKFDELDLDLGGYIGEYKETGALFVGSARFLINAWKMAHGRLPPKRRGSHRDSKNFWNDMSAAWLQLQFAVKPVCSDIYDAVNKLNGKAALAELRTIRAKEKDEQVTIVRTGANLEVGFTDWEITQTIEHTSVRYARRVPGHTEFNLGNPAEWAWEAIPFSFVVDWFIPIGDYIKSFDSMKGWTIVGGYDIVRRTDVAVGTYTRYKENSIEVITEVPRSYTKTSYSRFSASAVDLPSLPKFKNPVSFYHVTEAMALLKLLTKK